MMVAFCAHHAHQQTLQRLLLFSAHASWHRRWKDAQEIISLLIHESQTEQDHHLFQLERGKKVSLA